MRPLRSAVQEGGGALSKTCEGLHGREGFTGRRHSKREGPEVGVEFPVQGAEKMQDSRGRAVCTTQAGEEAYGLITHTRFPQ